jgi:lipopolysaccharide export system protein LptA
MYKQFIKKLPFKLVLISLVCCPLLSVSAKKTDFDQEIFIKANRQAGDLKNKVASYLDNVSITQGSLTINADLVQIYSDPKTEQKTYVAKGKPAIFQQLLEDGTPINLQAEEIKYEPGKKLITVTGNASVSQEGSLVKGNKITYNILTEQLLAESNAEDSVTTILKPSKTKPN